MNEYTQALETTKSYDTDMFLGRLAWYGVSEGLRLTCDEFISTIVREFENVFDVPVLHGPAKAPLYPKLSNVFKRACTAANTKNVATADEDVFYNYLVRPSGYDADHIWQTIVREAVDREGHTLQYTELVLITFTRSTEKIRFNNILEEDVEDENANLLVEGIVQYYQDNKDILTPYTIREWLRGFMERTLKATRVRPSGGGVYFVSEEYGDAVDALDRCFNGFGNESSFHYLPLLNDNKQREMLRKAFEDESVGAVDDLIGDLAEILNSDKKISSDTFANFKVQYDQLRNKTQEYSDLLEDALGGTTDRLDILNQMLVSVMGCVKV